MNISILIPSRNNLGFLQLAYNSIRKYQGNHFVEILVLDDISDKDNTWEWCLETIESDSNFKAFQNKRKERLGISGGYKFLAQQATQEIIGHFHADMVMTEGTLDAIAKELWTIDKNSRIPIGTVTDLEGNHIMVEYGQEMIPNKKNVVCLTRIEPPIYDKPGVYPEKIIWGGAPIEIEDWDEKKFLDSISTFKYLWNYKSTGGHFVPFFMFRDEYLRLGGVDSDSFKFQAREDSDFAFRLVLDGFKTIQIPHFVFHFASRGNRRSQHESGNFTDNPAWEKINVNSTRNFIRKWGTMRLHETDLTPIKPVKYNIGFKVKYCDYRLIEVLEPWCSRLVYDHFEQRIIENYINDEQSNTKFDLKSKCSYGDCQTDIVVEIDGNSFGEPEWRYIQNLSEIITQSGEIGQFELGSLKITIDALNHYENDLIVCKNESINLENE